jgi:hypothetical protein
MEPEEKERLEKQFQGLEKLTDKINDRSVEKEGVFISNAGVCLLAPWLPSFFKKLV